MVHFIIPLFALFIAMIPVAATAQNDLANQEQQNISSEQSTQQKYVSLRFDKSYMRKAPGENQPVIWIYQSPQFPMLVIRSLDNWQKLRDFDGEEGWIHNSQLSEKRSAVINVARTGFWTRADASSPTIATLGRGVIIRLEHCDIHWCHGNLGPEDKKRKKETSGWVQRRDIWGLGQNEILP